LVAEPDDGDLDNDEDDYEDDDYDDEDDYEGGEFEDEDDYYAYDGVEDAGESGRARRGRGTARPPGAPPLGSYESRQAALRGPERRRPFRFVLPVLALIAIGFGGLKLLAVRQDTQLPTQGDQRSPTSAASTPGPGAHASGTPASHAAGTTALSSFAAYPGQQGRDGGQFAVNSIAAANGEQLAVGSADGYPAIWRRGPAASWSLADSAVNGVLAGRPGDQTMTAVAHGPAGWLAVGGVVSGTQQHPVVVTSTDGQAWQATDGSPAFGAAGLHAYGAAAGRIDYVVVGEQVTGNTATAATWWSAGLGAWNRGSSGGLGSSGKPSEMFGVTVGPERFIAVGADGSQPAVWTSPNGQQWTVTDLALPAGATKAALRQVVANGTRVVATGNAETAKGTTAAFAEVSNDDGATWQLVALPSAGEQAAVTTLAASGTGFVAAGRSGQPNDPAAVVWTSADGSTWAPARMVPGPAGGKVQVITGLASAGGTVSGIGVAATKAGESPVVYTAPAPG
jgi:hypothetical protein